jgi:hypothetical protein
MYNEYITKDLGEAAALVTNGLVLKNINWKDNVAYFSFNEPDVCKETSQKYFFENLALPVRKFHENLKLIKSKLYASSQLINGRGIPGRSQSKGGGRNVQGQR